jgi:glycerate dehydrogenase
MPERIVFLDRDTIAPHITVRRPDFEHDWSVYDRTRPGQVQERLADATIAITNKAPIRKDVLDELPDLRMISIAATGSDVVDLDTCSERGVIVSNVQGYAINTVPEHTFGLVLALRRAIKAYHNDVMAGEWKKADQFCFFNHKISDLAGARLGIFGKGVIGQSVAKIARGFGMEPVFSARKGDDALDPLYTPFYEVIETSDVLTLHCPLTPQTRNMIGLEEFKNMKDSAIIINTARGGLIEENDLAIALQEGMIAGAGIDVVSQEPLIDDHPFHDLMALPNFILTPHVAWASTEAMQEVANQVISNIENFVSGRPSNKIAG